MVEDAKSGRWNPDPTAPAPCFDPTAHWASGAGGAPEMKDDGDVTDLASDTGLDQPDPPTRADPEIQTAQGAISYATDWDVTEAAPDPCLAAVKLLHVAWQMADTSRWWTMRWPQNAVSLIGHRPCG